MSTAFPRWCLLPAALLLASPWQGISAPAETLRPFLENYCYECHGPQEHKAELDFSNPDVVARLGTDHELLENLEWVLAEGEMPPKKSAHPPDEEREFAIQVLHERLTALENSAPDDPGLVLMPRLNQAEYNNVVRDLTGFDLEPARFFPADQIAETGFANMGAVLNVGTLHARNYLSGAKWVLEHALVSPERGIVWHPERIEAGDIAKVRKTLLKKWYDWLAKKEAEAFGQTPLDGADYDVLNTGEYLLAAWKYHQRAAFNRPGATFADFAAEAEGLVNPVILERWYSTLTREDLTPLLAKLQEGWLALPGPRQTNEAALREHCGVLEDFLYGNISPSHNGRWFNTGVRFSFQPDWELGEANEPRGRKLNRFKRRGFPDWAENLIKKGRYDFTLDLEKYKGDTLYLVVTDAWDGNEGDLVRLSELTYQDADGPEDSWEEAGIEMEVTNGQVAPSTGGAWTIQAPAVVKLTLPEEAAGKLNGSFRLSADHKSTASVQTLFLAKPPKEYEQHFYPQRQILAWPEKRDAVLQMVADLTNIFTRSGKISGNELSDALADVPDTPDDVMERLGEYTAPESYPDAPYFLDLEHLTRTLDQQEQARHQNLLSDLHAFAEVPQRRLARAYEKAGIETTGGTDLLDPEKLKQLQGHEDLVAQVRAAEERRLTQARGILGAFLRKVWRRPVVGEEIERYLDLYRESRTAGKNFDAAMKRPMKVALIVPDFIFKLQEAAPDEVAPLTDVELASRLSFFLWASMPDQELLDLAEAGELRDPDVLLAQADRMLRDDRSRALGIEFAGRWLGFHGFDDYSQPDMDTFPEYTPELREAMYEESIRFFQHLFAANRPVTDLIDARYTFLNETLANHYNIEGVDGPEMRQVALTDEMTKQRGGLFGLGSLLTVNATPLRAHPIYRGVWVIDKVLGTPTPEPPPVPPLSEAAPPGEELRFHEMLALHRADPACSVCHDRIDPPGLALEHFNAVGAWRQNDEEGQPVFAKGTMKDGRVVEGLDGVRTFVRERTDDLVEQFCTKLAIFGLGRELMVTDRPLIQKMAEAMEADQGRVRAGLAVLLTSPQFLEKRSYQTLPETLANTVLNTSQEEPQ